VLHAAPICGIEIHQERGKKLLWKIALINGLGSIPYLLAWNYSSSFVSGWNITRTNICFSILLMISALLYLGQLWISDVTSRRFFASKYFNSIVQVIAENLYMVSCVFYLMSKVLFILHAVYDLFHLPDEAYRVATCANYVPHIF
jgi:hypothetical protein